MNDISPSLISLDPTGPRNSPFWRALTADVDNTSEELDHLLHIKESKSTTGHLNPLPVIWGTSPYAEKEGVSVDSPDAHEPWSHCINPHLLSEPIHRSTNELNGLHIEDTKHVTTISSGANFCTYITTGKLSDRRIGYLSKCWQSLNPVLGFFTELSLLKSQLKEFQGYIVPAIIGVFCTIGKISVAMEAPHHSFWIEASPDMPSVLKRRCVEAFEKIHSKGVYHGDVHLSDMVIGGDANITILNFHSSRALVSNAAVGLRAADPADLLTEMRKVKFLLNYQDAQREEYLNYTQHSSQAAGTEIKGRKTYKDSPKLVDQLEEKIGRLPEDVYHWLPFPTLPPKRFVMPGQTKAVLESKIQHFLNIVDALEAETQFSYPSTPPPPPPPPNDHNKSDPETSLLVSELCAKGARYNLRSRKSSIMPIDAPDSPPVRSRTSLSSPRIHKRKVIENAESSSRPVKKIRFSVGSRGSCEFSGESGYMSGGEADILLKGRHFEHQVEAHDPPVITHDFAYGATSSKQRIINANIRRCIELGLPHPDAITQDPSNPHWRNPDITEYIRHHNQQAVQAIEMIQRHPGKPIRVPRPKRSEGSLKRAMTAISQGRSKPGITFTKSRDHPVLGKRKGQWEDGDISHISPIQLATTKGLKRLRSGTPTSPSNMDHRSSRHISTTQGSLNIPGSKFSGIMSKNRVGVTKTGKPQRTPIFYTRGEPHGNDITVNDLSLHQVPPSDTQDVSFLPREKRRWTSLPHGLTFFGNLGIRTPTIPVSETQISEYSRVEERHEKPVICPLNDLGITLMMTPPYAGLLTRCMGGFRRLLR